MVEIIELRISNVKSIEAMTIKPGGRHLVVTGKNGAGKTTAITSIAKVLNARNMNKDQIRNGADEANIKLDMGDYIFQRRTPMNGKQSITITSPSGLPCKNTEELLNRFYNANCINPFRIKNMTAKEQVDTLSKMIVFQFDTSKLPDCPDQMDMDGLEEYRKNIFKTRTDVGRDVKRTTEQLKAVEFVKKVDSVSTSELVKTRDELADVLAKHKETTERRRIVTERLNHLNNELKKIEDEIANLKEETVELDNTITLGVDDILQIEEDVERYNTSITNADKTNREAAEWESKCKLEKENFNYTTEYNKHTQTLDMIQEVKKDVVSRAIPIPGITIDDVVRINGVPVKELSTSEQYIFCLQVAMAQNPELKVVLVMEGWSSLDDESRKAVLGFAEEHDFDLWIEVVADEELNQNDYPGMQIIRIEDGSIVE